MSSSSGSILSIPSCRLRDLSNILARFREAQHLIGIGGELELIWQDGHGASHSEPMRTLELFVIRSLTPHVVINRSLDHAILIEFADGPQHNVDPIDLLNV